MDDRYEYAAMTPAWVFSFASWAAAVYRRGLVLCGLGVWRNLPWLVIVGRLVVIAGGLVLTSLYAVSVSNYGKKL